MSRRLQLHALLAVLSVGMMFTSCGNIDIVKRRYRPGFHVDVSKKREKTNKVQETFRSENTTTKRVAFKQVEAEVITSRYENRQETFTGTASASIEPQLKTRKGAAKKFNDFMLAPFREIKRQNLNGELKRAVFNKEAEEKYGWSGISFASTGIGVVALGLLIAGIVLLAAFLLGSAFAYWWVFLASGILLGIGALVTGILGMRKTGSGERRGRGFAIAGLVAGIVSLAGGLIALFWGLIFSAINGDDF